MHKEYATVCEITHPKNAEVFRIRWLGQKITFDFALPKERMQNLYSGLLDVLRRNDAEQPNTQNADFCRGARLGDSVRYFAQGRGETLRAQDFVLLYDAGKGYKPATVEYRGFTRYDRPDNAREHHPGRVFFPSKAFTRRDAATDCAEELRSDALR